MPGLSNRIKKRITNLGFSGFGIVDLDGFGNGSGEHLKTFLGNNYHGTMDWLVETSERRASPQILWPQARSAIVLSMNYGPDVNPLATLEHPEKATISVYARNRDYHNIIKGRLKEIAGLITGETGENVKVFVDTAPLMEKPLAEKAGIGWQGKHTNLVSRELGSWLFLGVILSAAKLTSTYPEADHCGSCRACLDICPTNAFPEPYQLDARLCISYLTIEHKGKVDENLRPLLGNRVFGCDDCLAVCPWNKFAQAASEAKLVARDDLIAPDLATLAKLNEAEFRTYFSGSPIKRIGWAQFMRNVLYAIGNSGAVNLHSAATAHIIAKDDAQRDAAIWAVQKLS